ncbi:hypothetical protein BDF20DRAFT_912247 [Mycotypha africana]|uniref:uncharacterized protein n=1 Tax=Mycotypha africana TaxID=64632 RepID=UPI002300EDD6|nr:uncharacterized protein BDF20DRAFT_912247 [Mycotypha africana]KAI8982044.1 hypothetical protein BDF20DRAFT_912247 [Mycotypha africana]
MDKDMYERVSHRLRLGSQTLSDAEDNEENEKEYATHLTEEQQHKISESLLDAEHVQWQELRLIHQKKGQKERRLKRNEKLGAAEAERLRQQRCAITTFSCQSKSNKARTKREALKIRTTKLSDCWRCDAVTTPLKKEHEYIEQRPEE